MARGARGGGGAGRRRVRKPSSEPRPGAGSGFPKASAGGPRTPLPSPARCLLEAALGALGGGGPWPSGGLEGGRRGRSGRFLPAGAAG